MTELRILLTNHTLADRGGSDLYVRDLAIALLDRGHRPVVYSGRLGTVADDLRLATVPVVDRLDALAETPDIIHGQHHLETMTALLHFPDVPAIFCCHGWLPWEEAPPVFPRLLRYVAVDDTSRDRLVCEHGVPGDRVSVLLNFVDLRRFTSRGPLPARPAAALLFCNEDGPHVAIVRDACARAQIALDVRGRAFGNASAAPGALLGQYDLVFAKARAALEALAVGAAVVLTASIGLGPMVTALDFDRLRRLNFGIRTLRVPMTTDRLLAEIARYDAADASEVSRRVRATAGLDDTVDAFLALYADVLAEWRRGAAVESAEESRSTARYLRSLAGPFKWALDERAALERRAAHAESVTDYLHGQIARERLQASLACAERDGLRDEIERARGVDAQLQHARATVANMERSRFWKARRVWTRVRGLLAPRSEAGR